MWKDLNLSVLPSKEDTHESDDVIFLLGIEAGPPRDDWTFGERALNSLIRNFQPSPVLTHVELFLMPETPDDETTFATYLGRKAGWGSSEPDTDFYLDGKNSWRAFPIKASRVSRLARIACEAERGAPYSLRRYATSVLPGRVIASLLPSSAGSPGHCATVSARILQAAGVALPRSAAWCSPSTLWLEATRPSRVDLMGDQSIVESESASLAAETLLRGSDDAVRMLTDSQCLAAIAVLKRRVVGSEVPVLFERQLARGLLRWGEIQRKRRDCGVGEPRGGDAAPRRRGPH